MSTASTYDLTSAFPTLRLFAPDEDDAAGDEGQEGSDVGTETPPSSPPAANAEDDEDEDDGSDIQDPDKKALHEEAAKWRRQLREAETRIQQLEDSNGAEALAAENNELRLRLAFERAAHDFADMDAAWKLAQDDLATVEIKDGTPDATRVGEIVAHVAKRYPYLVAEPQGAQADVVPRPAGPSGSPMNGRKEKKPDTSLKVLERKFPALRGHRR